ncbi:glycosyltransferase [Vogesella sp. LIG4]|uniref:glycosyltransferase n=1 Tax=Vogesella sp. LIG4 TaxID=1192162 RepID=UPI00081FA23C|nr:glycosyltransferase [Vogesella sp. LIG4]SCK09375.1 Glycosyltransferase [Vogesella sp. LIG4]
MTDKIIFLRSQLPKTDSRLQRYLQAVELLAGESIIVGWDRSNSTRPGLNEFLYKRKTRIGGGWANLMSLLCWNYFIVCKLWQLRKKYHTIHAIDLDTAIPALIFANILHKRLIFDIYDKYTDSRHFPAVLRFFADKIERTCANRASSLILADECRREQLELPHRESIVILENIPAPIQVQPMHIHKPGNIKITLAYVGILEPQHRGLEDLLRVVANRDSVQLLIAGDGGLRKFIEEYASKYEHIRYFGPVGREKAMGILASCDIQVGLYYKTIRNHYFAAPNKYYEHLMMGKPLVTTVGTPPGVKVQLFNTGYALNEGQLPLSSWLNTINPNEIKLKGSNALNLWQSNYSDYFNTTFLLNYKKCLGYDIDKISINQKK